MQPEYLQAQIPAIQVRRHRKRNKESIDYGYAL